MSIAFPTSLPSPASWQQSYVDDVIRTEVEAGVTKARRRYTRTRRTADATWRLTRVQFATLETFVVTTLANGAIHMTLRSPVDDTVRTWRIIQPMSVSFLDPSRVALEVGLRLEEV